MIRRFTRFQNILVNDQKIAILRLLTFFTYQHLFFVLYNIKFSS